MLRCMILVIALAAPDSHDVLIQLGSERGQGWVFIFRDQQITYLATESSSTPDAPSTYSAGPRPITVFAGHFHREAWVCTGGPLQGRFPGSLYAVGRMRRAIIGEKLGGLVATGEGWRANP